MNTAAADRYMAALREEGFDTRTPEQVLREALPEGWQAAPYEREAAVGLLETLVFRAFCFGCIVGGAIIAGVCAVAGVWG